MRTDLIAIFLLLIAVGCGQGELPEPPPPPTALETLDPSIREQFDERYAAVSERLSLDSSDRSEIARAFGSLGEWYHIYSFHGGARQAYQAAIELAEDDSRWLYFLAHIERNEGHAELAASLFEQVLAKDPSHLAASVWRAELDLEGGRLEEADAKFAAILERQPECVRALAGRGDIARAQQRWTDAAEFFERALIFQPKASSLRYRLGLIYRRLGDRERALTELAKAPAEKRHQVPATLEDPLMRELHSQVRGSLYQQSQGLRAFENGNYELAKNHFELALASDPSNVQALLNLSVTRHRLGEVEAAEEAVEEALRRSPESAKAHLERGLLYLTRRDADSALMSFRRAVTLDPGLALAQLNLAQLLRGRDACEQAVQHYLRAVEADPRLSAADHGRALCLTRLDRESEAIEVLRQARLRVPGRAKITLLLARLLSTAMDAAHRKGPEALELVEGLMGSGVSLHLAETRAMAHAELGEFRSAAEWQEAALNAASSAGLESTSPALRERLERYRRRQPSREPWARGEVFSNLPVTPPPT